MEELSRMLREMTGIRLVEEKIAKRYPQGEIRCPVHLSIGQEAVAVGICNTLEKRDWVFSGHRNHAHYLAKGGSLKAMISELYGRENGCSGGKGGSMHLTDLSAGFIAATPIVGSTIPIAVGAALTAQREKKGRVVVAFLGDGAMETGVVHESLNFASLRKLPIIFACENNLYSVYSPLEVRQPQNRSIADIALAHGIKSLRVDGNDVEEIYRQSKQFVKGLREESGPVFIEFATYRWREHCGYEYDNNIGYRSEAEFLEWKARDPIENCQRESKVELSCQQVKEIEDEIKDAFDVGSKPVSQDIGSDGNYVMAKVGATNNVDSNSSNASRMINYVDALKEAHELGITIDSSCYIMGLGVPDPKGIFGTTKGLQERFGEERVFNIPLSENAMTGVAIGSAITGMRPILTHQRMDFALVSIDQIVNQAAKWHYMFNGAMKVPMIIRMIIGRGWGQGPQHSQSMYSWFAHRPGLKVVVPSTAYDAKEMFLTALRDDNPIIFIEHRWLHGIRDEVPEGVYYVPLDRAKVRNKGEDITIITIGYPMIECMKAAKVLEENMISTEVIDLRSASPIDKETILESVARTGRLLVVEHAHSTCSIAAEVMALVSEEANEKLKNRPRRMCLPDYPVPTSRVQSSEYYSTYKDIAMAVGEILSREVTVELCDMEDQTPTDQPNRDFHGPF